MAPSISELDLAFSISVLVCSDQSSISRSTRTGSAPGYLRSHPGEAHEIARNVIMKAAKGREPWPDHREWLKLMETKSVEEVAQLLEEDSPRASRRRSSLPFLSEIRPCVRAFGWITSWEKSRQWSQALPHCLSR